MVIAAAYPSLQPLKTPDKEIRAKKLGTILSWHRPRGLQG